MKSIDFMFFSTTYYLVAEIPKVLHNLRCIKTEGPRWPTLHWCHQHSTGVTTDYLLFWWCFLKSAQSRFNWGTTSTCLHRISIYPPWNYIKQPLKIDGSNTTFLLGWPIFRSNVSFISRWFARFSFTAANIRLGLPRCLTLMNWSSWVRPKFVGSKMSRGLFFFEKVWVYCGKKQRFHSTVDVGASPQVPKMFLVNL